jgi:phosphohistidine phosphatase
VDSDQRVPRRLLLLRHAKSAWPQEVPDQDRPLAPRGVADATAAGPVLAGIAVPDVVLCSPALRTRQTWDLASQALTPSPSPRFEQVVYGASVPELLDLLRSVPDDTGTVLVLGHEPTMSATASALAGPGSAAADLAKLKTKYPTSGLTVFRLESDWSQLGAGHAVLEQFLVPRG